VCRRRRPAYPAGSPGRRTASQRDSGAAAVETAIVLPLLLLLVFGLIDFGRMLNAQITVTEAASEGARAAALGGDPVPRAKAAAGALEVNVDPGTPCAGDPTQDARVKVEHEFTFVTPIGALAGLFGGRGPDGEITLASTGVMPCQ
jgi:Flp pilus assembly protein TadG